MTGLMFAAVLMLPTAEPVANRLEIDKKDDVIEFKVDGELAGKYHVAAKQAKPYLWPVHAPGGIGVTRDWPIQPKAGDATDHVHQKSVWFCHGDLQVDDGDQAAKGRKVKGADFWTETPLSGKIESTTTLPPIVKSERGIVTTRLKWKSLGGQAIVEESRDIELIPLATGRLWLFHIHLKAIDKPVIFGDTKEGSFGVRVSEQLCLVKNPKSMLTNSAGGDGEKACWGHKADWCDYSGTVDGKPVGVAVFDHVKNPSRACWHVRAYGLLAANPFGRAGSGFPAYKDSNEATVRLKAGEELHLRYGLFAHVGDAKTGQVAETYQRFLALAP